MDTYQNVITHCFYHSADLDGHCSGAIVKLAHPEAVMHPINYGDPFPWNEVKSEDVVIMVDFALQPFSDMQRLNDSCTLVWIDHHKSALEAYDSLAAFDLSFGIVGRHFVQSQPTMAACKLCWLFFAELPSSSKAPLAVELLSLYDSWTYQGHELEDMVLPLQARLKMEDLDPRSEHAMYLWQTLFGCGDHGLHPLVEEGRLLLRFEESQSAKYMQTYSLNAILPGVPSLITSSTSMYRALVVNHGMVNSLSFSSKWDRERYHLMSSFVLMTNGKWRVSLYSDRDDVDCSAIAKAWGGGGHKGAAGFQCDKLPYIFGGTKW